MPKANDPKRTSATTQEKEYDSIEDLKQRSAMKSLASGFIAGGLASHIGHNTGALVALHEVLGHGLLGMRLTSNYPDGQGPSYHVKGFDTFKNIEKADSVSGKIGAFFSWLFVPSTISGSTAGTANRGRNYTPNELACHIGPHGTDAWISLTGVIPGMIINSACVTAGMLLRRKSLAVATGLLSFGFFNHISDCMYVWDAAVMSTSEMHKEALTGHDFASFACQLSEVTHTSASTIAISTAVAFTSVVPLLALGIYLFQRANRANIVPDDIALRFWLSKMKTDAAIQETFKTLYQNYPNKEKLPFELKDDVLALKPNQNHDDAIIYSQQLGFRRGANERAEGVYTQYMTESERVCNKAENAIAKSIEDFTAYLKNNIAAKDLKAIKEKLLEEWLKQQKPPFLQQILGYATLGTVVVSFAAQIINLLSQTSVPSLLAVSVVLKVITPFFGILSILNSIHEVYKDFQLPHDKLPITAKTLSCMKLLTNMAMVSLLITAAFVPGLQFVFIPVVIISSLLIVAMSFAKMKVMQKQFAQQSQTGKPSHLGLFADTASANNDKFDAATEEPPKQEQAATTGC